MQQLLAFASRQQVLLGSGATEAPAPPTFDIEVMLHEGAVGPEIFSQIQRAVGQGDGSIIKYVCFKFFLSLVNNESGVLELV